MTVTVFLSKETYLEDINTMVVIFRAEKVEVVEIIRQYMKPLSISLDKNGQDIVAINLSVEELTLLSIYMNGTLK